MREGFPTPENLANRGVDTQETPEAAEQQFEYHYVTDQEQRHLLAERVSELVERTHKEGVSTIIFLDKSARPLVTLFSDIWNAKHKKGKKPEFRFLNVGSEKTERLQNLLEEKSEGDKDLPSPQIGGSEEYQKLIDGLSEETLDELVGEKQWEEFKELKQYIKPDKDGNAKVLVLDEYSNTGASLALAQKIIESAFKDQFPNLTVDKTALAKYGDQLFLVPGTGIGPDGEGVYDPRKVDRKYNPPWRLYEHDPRYGVTGVEDREKGKEKNIFASADRGTRRMKEYEVTQFQKIINDLKERREQIARKISSAETSLKHLFHDLGDTIKIADNEFRIHDLQPLAVAMQQLSKQEITADTCDAVIHEIMKILSMAPKNVQETKWFQDLFSHSYFGRDDLPRGQGNEDSNAVLNKLMAWKLKYKKDIVDGRSDIYLLDEEIHEYEQQIDNQVIFTDSRKQIRQLRKEMHQIAKEYLAKI